jgi:hypothetical protein
VGVTPQQLEQAVAAQVLQRCQPALYDVSHTLPRTGARGPAMLDGTTRCGRAADCSSRGCVFFTESTTARRRHGLLRPMDSNLQQNTVAGSARNRLCACLTTLHRRAMPSVGDSSINAPA